MNCSSMRGGTANVVLNFFAKSVWRTWRRTMKTVLEFVILSSKRWLKIELLVLFVFLFFCLFVCSCVRPSVRPFVRSFVHSFICFFICLFVCWQLLEGEVIQPQHTPTNPQCPVVYRQHVYFCSGEECREKFMQCPSKFLKQPTPKPVVPIRMAIIGPPKSGKTTCECLTFCLDAFPFHPQALLH